MKIVCAFGQHNYGDPARGISYEYANFLPALRRLGHDVIHLETWHKSSYRNFTSLNRTFLEKIASVQPDVILCVLMNYELWLETLHEVRRRCKAVVVHWGTDDSWKYEPFAKWVAPAFDIYATTARDAFDKANREGHRNFFLTQWAANGSALREPQAAEKCRYPVSFVGSAYGSRPRWISQLEKNGIEVACFGHGWKQGPVASEEIPEIIRNSVISLNFGEPGLILRGFGAGRSRQIKARVFEVPGAGGFLLTQGAPQLNQFYDVNKEIVTFEGIDDLRRKIEFFLTHPGQRDEIAKKGHGRTLREHTYEHRFTRLLEVVNELRARRAGDVASLACELDSEWFASVAARHNCGFLLQVLRRLLLVVFGLFFGRRRGARAARRFVYEISWRTCRERTYTAAGIPGRLFYRES